MVDMAVTESLKTRDFFIGLLLNHSTRVYMDDLYRWYQKHLIRLDTALIENDIQVLSEYAEVGQMSARELNEYMRVFKWNI